MKFSTYQKCVDIERWALRMSVVSQRNLCTSSGLSSEGVTISLKRNGVVVNEQCSITLTLSHLVDALTSVACSGQQDHLSGTCKCFSWKICASFICRGWLWNPVQHVGLQVRTKTLEYRMQDLWTACDCMPSRAPPTCPWLGHYLWDPRTRAE